MIEVGKIYTYNQLRDAGYARVSSFCDFEIWYGNYHFVYVRLCGNDWLVTEIHDGGW